MEYATACALKNAGFPQSMQVADACYVSGGEEIVVAERCMQGNGDVFIFHRDMLEYRIDASAETWIKKPSLSELVAACEEVPGYHLFCLEHPREGWLAAMAADRAIAPLETYESGGYQATPEEAVACLWLALQAHAGAKRHEEEPVEQRRASNSIGSLRMVRST